MSSCTLLIIAVAVVLLGTVESKSKVCEIPETAPQKIESVINECQDEIKIAILSEALEALSITEHKNSRAKRSAFSRDEKRIAGCLLQCVYRKMKAVNEKGFPTTEGLVKLYTEGITQKEYILATLQSVSTCLVDAHKKHLTTPQAIEQEGKTCDIAYDIFDCVSEKIGEYCGQTP
ncbi:general odorant-binding protein 70 [Aethina tumida]|uniref:Odorant-binding protein 4 n=1 Tax=Aethina tumida TaxID=116153 RepID=A0A6M3VYD6_AETTU|nr:general odorant-binding protein 70 [Aethina tumida]QJF45549.1 odorant-binding protein 4 [Aethina tumida]